MAGLGEPVQVQLGRNLFPVAESQGCWEGGHERVSQMPLQVGLPFLRGPLGKPSAPARLTHTAACGHWLLFQSSSVYFPRSVHLGKGGSVWGEGQGCLKLPQGAETEIHSCLEGTDLGIKSG